MSRAKGKARAAAQNAAAQLATENAAMRALIDEALAYRADHFDGDGDTYISGADMLDWFHAWRIQVKKTLGIATEESHETV